MKNISVCLSARRETYNQDG